MAFESLKNLLSTLALEDSRRADTYENPLAQLSGQLQAIRYQTAFENLKGLREAKERRKRIQQGIEDVLSDENVKKCYYSS
jgi:hypothetical protein